MFPVHNRRKVPPATFPRPFSSPSAQKKTARGVSSTGRLVQRRLADLLAAELRNAAGRSEVRALQVGVAFKVSHGITSFQSCQRASLPEHPGRAMYGSVPSRRLFAFA